MRKRKAEERECLFPMPLGEDRLGEEESIPKDRMSMDTLKDREQKRGWESEELQVQVWQQSTMVQPTGSGIIQTQSQIPTPPLTKLYHLGQIT